MPRLGYVEREGWEFLGMKGKPRMWDEKETSTTQGLWGRMCDGRFGVTMWRVKARDRGGWRRLYNFLELIINNS